MNENNWDFTEEKSAEATGEILINEAEFDEAVIKALDEIRNNEQFKGGSAFVISLTGISFASHMKKFLFENQGKEENTND